MTGASRGIGRAVATALADAGASVTLVARGADALHALASQLGTNTVVAPCDVSDARAVAAVVAGLRASGRMPDVLVNNAGLFPLAALDEMAAEDFEHTVRVNLIAPFLMLRQLLPDMKQQGRGHVVTIGSVADRTAFAGNGAYAASKYGQRAMHEVLRQELRGSGVRGTLVSPAATDTPIWDPIDPDNQPGFPSRAAMLRPDDVARAVVWALMQPAHVNIDEIRLSST